MAGHPSSSERGLGHSILVLAVIVAALVLLLLALTPFAAAAPRRDVGTWYECCDVVGAWGWTGSTDGDVIIWPRGSGDVRFSELGSDYSVHGIDMVTTKVGYLVTHSGPGARGKVFKTTDGGVHWKVKKTARVDLLATVRFRSKSLGWAAGRGGTILKTTNGGKTWVKQRTPTSKTLYWLAFPSDKVGYACGSGGLMLKTTNGGKTWVKQRSGVTQTLYSVDFVGTSRGWACGGDTSGVFIKTTNGGRTWRAVLFPLPPLVAVDFATRSQGYAVGNVGTPPAVTGKLYKLGQGGDLWTDQTGTVDPSPPTYGLACLKVMSATEAYAEGQSEASLYTDDGVVWHLAHISSP